MRKDVAKKWIKALKSGKYKQGTGFLKHYNSKGEAKHCCLGVLCELYNDAMKKNHKKTLVMKNKFDDGDYNNASGNYYGYATFNGKDQNLPETVRKWAGIKTNIGAFPDITIEQEDHGKIEILTSLADINDNGTKFKTIAKIIEKNIDTL